MTTNRDRLNQAFKLMRQSGLIARQRFSCCGGCASYEMGEELDKKAGLRHGAAYYHRQEGDRLDRGAEVVFVGFGARERGLMTDEAVGSLVKACAERAGLEVEWTGDASRCVEIKLPGGIDAVRN